MKCDIWCEAATSNYYRGLYISLGTAIKSFFLYVMINTYSCEMHGMNINWKHFSLRFVQASKASVWNQIGFTLASPAELKACEKKRFPDTKGKKSSTYCCTINNLSFCSWHWQTLHPSSIEDTNQHEIFIYCYILDTAP